MSRLICLLGICLLAQPVLAETRNDILNAIQQEAATTAGFKGFSPERGELFFKNKHGSEWSCSSCHTNNPAAMGRHAKTDKDIDPLAPSANPDRFTSMKKVEKWFKRNCNDVLGRTCTAQEKGDVMSYLLNVKK